MCRLLCSLLVSLAVTDGAVPYPSCTCQRYSQPLENHLLNHQLEQCIDSQSYRLITHCLHNHAMYIQGPGGQNVFQSCPLLLLPVPHQRIQTPGGIPMPWHCHHAPVPPSTPNAMQRLQPRTGVCLPNTWKAYLTGTVMQTSEIMDQLCPKKSGSACWEHDPGYRVNSPLHFIYTRFSVQLITFLMTPTPSWLGIAGFAYR